jgi:cell division protein FtsB
MDLRVKQLSEVSALPRPRHGLQLLLDHAPLAEAFAERSLKRLRPALQWLYHSRRRLATFSVALLTLWLFLHVMLGANGMVIYRQKRAEYQGLQQEIDGLEKENSRYTGQIKALKTDPSTIEKEAREQLHYARPGEVVYVAPPPLPSQAPETNAARK